MQNDDVVALRIKMRKCDEVVKVLFEINNTIRCIQSEWRVLRVKILIVPRYVPFNILSYFIE